MAFGHLFIPEKLVDLILLWDPSLLSVVHRVKIQERKGLVTLGSDSNSPINN